MLCQILIHCIHILILYIHVLNFYLYTVWLWYKNCNLLWHTKLFTSWFTPSFSNICLYKINDSIFVIPVGLENDIPCTCDIFKELLFIRLSWKILELNIKKFVKSKLHNINWFITSPFLLNQLNWTCINYIFKTDPYYKMLI